MMSERGDEQQQRRFSSETELRNVLSALGSAIEQSSVFKRVSRDRLFTAVVELSDPEGRFCFVLDHGRVRAGTGRLTAPSMITFRLTSGQFDGFLRGLIPVWRLMLPGGARTSGNILHALPLHDLLPETILLYRKIDCLADP